MRAPVRPHVERGDWTRLRILLEVVRGGARRVVDLADALGVSAQAVSYQLKAMEAEGHVVPHDAGVRATAAGVEWLHENVLELKRFLDGAVTDLLPLERCSALASEALAEGEEVGLFMERGRLVARKRPSPSRGRVARAAPAGGVVVVHQLRGIVDLPPGRILACVLPDPLGGLPPPARLKDASETFARAPALVCVAGVDAGWLARHAGFGDLCEYAAAAVALDAARSGLDVLVVVSAALEAPVLEALQAGAKQPGGPRVDVVRL